jgi:hypothetical protein
MDNEIKKLLYKEKPDAHFKKANKEGLLYRCEIDSVAVEQYFLIPFNEIGDAAFFPSMSAQYLIRYAID